MRKLSYVEAVCTINFVILLVILGLSLEQFTRSSQTSYRSKEPVLTPAQVEAIKKGSGSRPSGTDTLQVPDDSAEPKTQQPSSDAATGEGSDPQSTSADESRERSLEPKDNAPSESEPE